MIDFTSEKLLLVADVPAYYAEAIGKELGRSTVRNWYRKGHDGVRLEVCYRAGLLHTSKEALQRFDSAVTEARMSRLAKKRADRALANSVVG